MKGKSISDFFISFYFTLFNQITRFYCFNLINKDKKLFNDTYILFYLFFIVKFFILNLDKDYFYFNKVDKI